MARKKVTTAEEPAAPVQEATPEPQARQWRVTLTKPVRLGVRNFLRPSAERILVDDATLALLKAENAIDSCEEFRPAVQA